MIVFFNDTFIEDEFDEFEFDSFEQSVKNFITISATIQKKRDEFSQRIYFKADSALRTFCLNFEPNNGDLFELLLRQLDTLNVKFWNTGSRQDEECRYYFVNSHEDPPQSVEVSRKTLAETAALKRAGENNILALNLPDLKFSRLHQIAVSIVPRANPGNISLVSIDCSDNATGLAHWIDSKLKVELQYTDDTRTPRDEETCLNNLAKFSRVANLRAHGRDVYRDIEGRYWYVDNLHTGDGAHLEVFGRQGNHLGEATLKGEIDYSKAGADKTLTV